MSVQLIVTIFVRRTEIKKGENSISKGDLKNFPNMY